MCTEGHLLSDMHKWRAANPHNYMYGIERPPKLLALTDGSVLHGAPPSPATGQRLPAAPCLPATFPYSSSFSSSPIAVPTLAIPHRVVLGDVNMGRTPVQPVDAGHNDHAAVADNDELRILRNRNELGRIVEEALQVKWERYFDKTQRAYYWHCAQMNVSSWTPPTSSMWCEYY